MSSIVLFALLAVMFLAYIGFVMRESYLMGRRSVKREWMHEMAARQRALDLLLMAKYPEWFED